MGFLDMFKRNSNLECDDPELEKDQNKFVGSVNETEFNMNDGVKDEEEKINMARKNYMYIAVDKDYNVLYDSQNNPYTKLCYEGDRFEWYHAIKDIAIFDERLRVEIPNLKNLSNKNKKENKKNACKELMSLIQDLKDEKCVSTSQRIDDIDVEIQGEIKGSSTFEHETMNIENATGKEKTNIVNTSNSTNEITTKLVQTSDEVLQKIVAEIEQLDEKADKRKEDILEASYGNADFIKNKIEECAGHVKNTEQKGQTVLDSVNKTNTEVAQIKATVSGITPKVKEVSNNTISSIKSAINESKNALDDTQGIIKSKVTSISQTVKDMTHSVESIEGKLSSLSKLDTIAEILQDKGLTLSLEIPPVNADEEDIVNLVHYSQKITEQLGYAARELLRKQVAFKSQEESNSNEQQVMERKKAEAFEAGVLDGKKQFIEKLVEKYSDIDYIKESEDSHIHVIWTLLSELGVSIDGDGNYEKGNELVFNEQNVENMIATYSKLEGAGKYKVVKTGIILNGEIISKAEFEKIQEESVSVESPPDN